MWTSLWSGVLAVRTLTLRRVGVVAAWRCHVALELTATLRLPFAREDLLI